MPYVGCFASECALGNFLADAFLNNGHVEGSGIATIAFMQAGGIRAPLPRGRKYPFELHGPNALINILCDLRFHSNHIW